MTDAPTHGRTDALVGVVALAAAVLIAVVIGAIQDRAGGNPERAVAITGVFCMTMLGLAMAAYAVPRRARLDLAELSLAALTFGAIILAGVYLFWAGSAVFHRADILLWSESAYVSDIIKLRTGYPLYGAPADLDAFTYPPLPPILTYLLAKLTGQGTSVAAYRVVQLLYVAAAALVCVRATRRIAALAELPPRDEPSWLWPALWTVLLFLVGTNLLTNPFVHLLHGDALSLLVSAVAFTLLIEYAATRSVRVLAALCVIPAIGFLAKQSLAIWAALLVGYLVVFDRPRSWKRIAIAGAVAFGLTGVVYFGGRLVYGDAWHYWLVTMLKNHAVSPLRSVQHVLDTWMFFGIGIAGAVVLLRGRLDDALLGPWIVWLLFITAEAYTSGVAWMINHIGPGSLIAMTWFGAALARLWPRAGASRWTEPASWLRPLAAVTCCFLLLSGLGALRIPIPAMPPDLERYTAAIEAEVRGQDPARVLVDHGSWVYLDAGVIMKDRMAAAGEAGWTATGDFSGLLGRVRSRYYARILVHDLDSPDFQYDHEDWPRSSGIREALKEHYRVVRTIPGVEGLESPWFKPIVVLEPRDST